MARPRAPFAILAALLAAAGCAAPGPYPSLAPRPAEKAYAEDADERKPTPQPDDPAPARQARPGRLMTRDGKERSGFGAAARLAFPPVSD
jgi:hypothetical protein